MKIAALTVKPQQTTPARESRPGRSEPPSPGNQEHKGCIPAGAIGACQPWENWEAA